VRFRLTKWYCDCVSQTGDVFVGYWANASYGPVSIPYVASFEKPAHGIAREQAAFRACAAPTLRGDVLDWRCDELGIRGCWQRSVKPCRKMLLNDASGSILWDCRIPAATAQVGVDHRVLVGLGYAEELTVSVAPSRLPFDDLEWGRFVSERESLTWIVWRGGMPTEWVFRNGSEVSGAVVDDRHVRLPDGGLLEFADTVPLRERGLAAAVPRGVPGARWWLLRGIRNARETKWLSRGTFGVGPHRSVGWVIHERVRLRP